MKVTKLLNFIFTCVAIGFLIISFSCLFIGGTAVYKESTWGINSSYHRIDLDPEYSYKYGVNFFDRMDIKSTNGFGNGVEVFAIIFIVITLGLLVASIFVKFLKNFYFSAAPLLASIFMCIVAGEGDTSYVIYHKYLGTTSGGYKAYTEKTVRFNMVAYGPIITFLFFVFFTMLAAGIMYMIYKRLEKQQIEAATPALAIEGMEAPVAEMPVEEELVEEEPVEEEPVEEASEGTIDVQREENTMDLLKRYKELLDTGVITQEEFDAKKKELLGL